MSERRNEGTLMLIMTANAHLGDGFRKVIGESDITSVERHIPVTIVRVDFLP